MKITAGQCRNLKDVSVPSTLKIGPYAVDPPVVLAPMAGITNVAFRQLCRQYGAGLYVCEMITARALVERDAMTMHMITFDEGENPRSMQLYGVDPKNVGEATKMIVDENLADHMDMNFGCPVPKVTRKGGGAALPYKRELFRQIVQAAVRNAGDMPVTVKFRIGIDDEHLTYLDAGRIAQDEGAQAVALHARTASQRYSGKADWDAIARLKEAVTNIPVLGNGDIFSAQDALDMVARPGATAWSSGVAVWGGRGCSGTCRRRSAESRSRKGRSLGEVAEVLRTHARLLAAHDGEHKGLRDLRKHMAWYWHGFPVGGDTRRAFAMVSSLQELDDLIGQLDGDVPFPENAEGPRGRQGSSAKVVLPEGWLDDPEDATVPAGADVMHSGG